MKELSIEEKAKLYDEAIERVDNIMTGKCETTFMFTKGLFEHIFPELKESEDEIRKAVIDAVETLSDSPLKVKMLAWLEEQGGQKPAEWSEEDKDMLGMLLEMINYASDHYQHDDKATDIKAWVLNSLKDRIQPQPKNEWSEEVEAAISLLKDIAEEQEKDYCPHNANDLRKAALYLETCKYQSTLKPSDKHYELEEFARVVRSNLTGISKTVQKLFEAKYLQLTGRKMYIGFKD